MTLEPRPRDQRRRDTEQRLTADTDLWLASASADGVPYLVPLSFDWDGDALLVAMLIVSLPISRTSRRPSRVSSG